MERIPTLIGAAGVCLSCVAFTGERTVVEGFNPAFSPDGRRLAFQRLDGNVFKIGVVDVAGGAVEWVEDGPGNAAYPSWTPSGGLVYMAGHDVETAHEAWHGGSKNGYGLRLWENGRKRVLTSGRCRDYTPCVSPDGRKVYFTTTRGVTSESRNFSKAAASRIAELDIAGGGEPRILMDSPNGNNSGFVQPAISPDGATLVWGHLESFFGMWRIYGTRVGRFSRQDWCSVSPPGLSATAPRWHPGGRILCYTGFRKGDPGWGVWVQDVYSGKVKRLATGSNPCFSPDGSSIAYDRGGKVFVCRFAAEDLPDESMPEPFDGDDKPETVLWTKEGVEKEMRIGAPRDKFAFGTDKTVFVRIRVKLDGTDRLRQLLIGDYAESDQGFQLFVKQRDVWFSTRNSGNRFIGVKSADYSAPGEYVLTGIRTPKRLLVSVNGLATTMSTSSSPIWHNTPVVNCPGDLLPLDNFRRFIVGRGLRPGERIAKVEVGTGWPVNVPKTRRREDLFK